MRSTVKVTLRRCQGSNDKKLTENLSGVEPSAAKLLPLVETTREPNGRYLTNVIIGQEKTVTGKLWQIRKFQKLRLFDNSRSVSKQKAISESRQNSSVSQRLK